MDNSKNNSLSYNLNHPNEAGTNLLQLESQYHRTLINNNLSVNESQDNLLKRKRVSSNREEDGTSMPISQDNKDNTAHFFTCSLCRSKTNETLLSCMICKSPMHLQCYLKENKDDKVIICTECRIKISSYLTSKNERSNSRNGRNNFDSFNQSNNYSNFLMNNQQTNFLNSNANYNSFLPNLQQIPNTPNVLNMQNSFPNYQMSFNPNWLEESQRLNNLNNNNHNYNNLLPNILWNRFNSQINNREQYLPSHASYSNSMQNLLNMNKLNEQAQNLKNTNKGLTDLLNVLQQQSNPNINNSNLINNVTNLIFLNNSVNLNSRIATKTTNKTNKVEIKDHRTLLTNLTQTNNKALALNIPIEDSLLIQYPEKYKIPLETFKRPEFKSVSIPSILSNKLISIWDYLQSFKSVLHLEDMAMCNDNFEQFYLNLTDKKNKTFLEILKSLLLIILKGIQDADNIPEVFMFKVIVESNDPMTIINYIYSELLEVVLLKLYEDYVNEEVKCLLQNNKLINEENTSDEEKIALLFSLITVSYKSCVIREQITKENHKNLQLQTAKASYEDIIKETEKRIRDIMSSNRYISASKKISHLEQQLEEFKEDSERQKQVDDIRLQIEQCKHIMQEKEKLDKVSLQTTHKLEQVCIELEQLRASRNRLVGTDVFRNEYYFFPETPYKIFIKISKLNTKHKDNWYYYDNKETIQELIDKLVEVGIRERKLKSNLKKTLREKFKDFTPREIKHNEQLNINDAMVDYYSLATGIIFSMEAKLTDTLKNFDKQWENEKNITTWKRILSSTKDFNNLTNTLRMITIRFNYPYKIESHFERASQTGDDDDRQYFMFTCEDGNNLVIYEYNPNCSCAKIKLWPSDSANVESYFTETFMESITSYHKLIYGLYFIEALVLKWISKKETVLKKNNPKEQTEQIEKSLEDNTDMLMGNNEQEPLNNIVDIDKTESIKTLSNKSFKNKMNVIKHKLYKKKIAGNKNKPKHSNKISWSNKCYICRDYGDLICCDSCSNVAHLFCVCLENLPDVWYCERCSSK